MNIHDVLHEIVASSVIILGIYGLIITTSQDIFDTICPPMIEGSPIPQYPVFRYSTPKAKHLRWLLGRIPWALFCLYILGTLFIIFDALKIIDILPQMNLQLQHFKFAVDILNYLSLIFVMYVVGCLVSVRSNPNS